MARPPRLAGAIPTVRADWQWGGVSWVTTEAVLTGAWCQPSAKRGVLLFANVSAESVTAEVQFDARPYGLKQSELRVLPITPDGVGQPFTASSDMHRQAVFPPASAWAWEISSN